MEYKYVHIFFEDHCSIAEWVTLDEVLAMKLKIAEKAGWIIDENDNEMKVASERILLEHTFSCVTVIKKSCIIGMKEL